MIMVHHLENSRSQRILWLLEELGLPYEVVRYERDPKTMLAPPALKRVHPLGKSPVIEDEGAGDRRDRRDRRLSGREGGRPARPAGQSRFGAALPPVPPLCRRLDDAALVRPARSSTGSACSAARRRRRSWRCSKAHFDWLESELAARDWFAGDEFTAADIMMSFPLEVSRGRAGLGPDHPHLADWLERIHARPAYSEALKKGGPYAYA